MRYLIVGILLAFTLTAAAQKVLVLEKVGRGGYFTYKEGDIIRLKTIIGEFNVQEKIFKITDSSIVVGGSYAIPFTDIAYIEKFFRKRKGNGTLLMIAGGALVAITSINNLTHNNVVIDPLFLSIGVGMTAAGGIWYAFAKRKYHVGKRWKLKVLDGFL